jgi:hypothetical protein
MWEVAVEWDCSHACAAIYMHKETPEEYVDEYLKMGKYMLAYADRVYGKWKVHKHDQLMMSVIQSCRRTIEGLPRDQK